ncbi:YdaS family helix-turn-helix protein [Roseomonas mucosa]|uniref:YdaS family helix-turn-helix protein n=1 Tax=Roseomonas mucosa TaxID=207340 RepID=UPI0022477E41|nr:YdaS family helix-turn-helix protein [Roseomonas mucosa]
MPSSPLSRAIAAAGGQEAFLAAVAISRRTLAEWKRDGVPDTRWAAVEAATSGLVSAEDLAADRAISLKRREARRLVEAAA